MKDFITTIVQQLVENPEAVRVDESEQDGRFLYEITVADEDMGRVIGREGKVINSIRMIMKVMAIRQNIRVRIDVKDKHEKEADQAEQADSDTAPAEAAAPAQASNTATTEETNSDDAETEAAPSASDFVGEPTTVIDNSK